MRRSVVAVASVAVAGLAVWLLRPTSSDSEELAGRLLAAGPQRTSFETVLPDRRWDTVCYLDPYDRPSLSLTRHLEEDVTDFVFEPSDRYLAEEETGIALVDHDTKFISVYTLEISERRAQETILQIVGPRCIKRETAYFAVEDVDGLNLDYKRLTFIAGD
jgi:hypothetical protein